MPTRDEAIAALTGSGAFELTEDTSEGLPPLRVFKNAPASLREVLKGTLAHGDRPFLIYEDEVTTYAQHYGQVAALAQRLLDAGVVKGDRVAIGMRNYPEWSLSWWACQAIGAIAVSLNAWWTTPEMAFALEDASPAALLVDGERLERLEPLLPHLEGCKLLLIARRGGAGPGGEDFAAAIASPRAELPDADVGPGDLATILYTSGTTGNPKGAMATHRNHVTNLMNSLLGRRRGADGGRDHRPARSRRAAAGRAADLPVLPHRRPLGALRRRGDRDEARADVQVDADRGRAGWSRPTG